MATKKKRGVASKARPRDASGRFLSAAAIEKIENAAKRSAASKKGWQTRRAKQELIRQGVTGRRLQRKLDELPTRERKKLARAVEKRKISKKPKAAPPKPASKSARWFLRSSTPAAKAVESRKAREQLVEAGYDNEEARQLVRSLSRKAKKQIIREGLTPRQPTKRRSPRKKSPPPEITQEASKELAKKIKALQTQIRKAPSKKEKERLRRQLESLKPTRLTKAQAAREKQRRKEAEIRATELTQVTLNIPGAPAAPSKLNLEELTNAEVMEERSVRYLEKMARDYENASVTSFINADGTIDSELTVPIPRGMTAQQVSTRLAANSARPPSNSWLAGGIMFQLRVNELEDQWRYQQYLGMSMISSYPVSMKKSRPAAVFAAMNEFSENQADSGKLKPSKVVVRLHNGKNQPRYYFGDIEQ